MNSRWALRIVVAALASRAYAEGDVRDQFFRYTEKEHRAFFSEMPNETVDPFTGTLRIVQTDLVLPGKAGLDVRITRSYASKIWGRTDLLDIDPLLAEKEHSPLGYGWSFHMGRLKYPLATGASQFCSGDFPVFEAPDGTARVFYPTATTGLFKSKDYWLLSQNCTALGGAGACIWSTDGVRYEFSNSFNNAYWYGANLVLVWPTSAIADSLHPNNRISVSYLPQSGAVKTIADTYGRVIDFNYSTHTSGYTSQQLLDSVSVNGNIYGFQYTLYQSTCSTGCFPLPGSGRFFLTGVQPPTGPGYSYQYATSSKVAQNQYALSQVTYPGGGTTSYVYNSSAFFTGYDSVPFAVVAQRVVGGRGVTNSETWGYSYSVPGIGTALNVTTITRPDGRADTYSMYGMGYVVGLNQTAPTGNAWMVGLTKEIGRANRAEVETLTWEKAASTISSAYYGAPVYSICGVYPVYDSGIFVPELTRRSIARDGATFTTDYSSFDAYGQPRVVSETGSQTAGVQTRSTNWTYSYVSDPGVNWVRGRPLTQHVVAGGDTFDNTWAYYSAPTSALKSQTLSGVTTTFDYDTDGNLWTVKNALDQTLTLTGYVAGWGIPTSLNFNGAFTVAQTAQWEGWLTSRRNGRGFSTQYVYDAIGRLKQLTPPIGDYTTFTYATDGSSVVTARGLYGKTTYVDGLGRTTSSSDSEGVQGSFKYDNMGRTWFKSYPYDASVGEVGESFVFDGLGRVTTRTKAYRPGTGACDVSGGCTETYSFPSNCVTRTVNRASSDSTTSRFCNGSYGDPGEVQVRQVTPPDKITGAANGYPWEYTYTGHGDLESVTAPLAAANRSHTYFPTTWFLKSDVTGESGTTTYERNALGQMRSRTDARGVLVIYGYADPLSRLRTITYGGTGTDDVLRDYDNESNLKNLSSPNGGSFVFGYDELNRMTSQSWTFGGKTYASSAHYNAAGCMDSMTYPTGTTVTMTCDSANRTTSISVGGSTIAKSIGYHPSSQPKAFTFAPSNKTTSIIHDDRGRVSTVTASGVAGLTYGYDGADNVTSFNNSVVTNASRAMGYDKLDRIVTSIAQYQWGSTAYDYDEVGNRTLKSEAVTTNYLYDAKNRLKSAGPPTGVTSFEPYPAMTLTWDRAGRLAGTSDGATYLYDGRGRRVQKTDSSGTTVFHYDTLGRLIAETLPSGTKVRDYFYLGNRLIAVDGCVSTTSCTDREWYHVDPLGTPLARTDAAGAVTATFDHMAWGERWSGSGVAGDRQYNGRVFDPGTGFHDYGARVYWPQIGRFISADSVMGQAASPATLNRYSYVLNNPYKYVDPTGNTTWPASGGYIYLPFAVVDALHPDGHNGVDIPSTSVVPWPTKRVSDGVIVASDAGVVEEIKSNQFGNMIFIRHEDGSISGYAHTLATVNKGDPVKEGEAIGLTDNSGLTTGPHLHYTLRKGTPQHPASLSDPTVNPKEHLKDANPYPADKAASGVAPPMSQPKEPVCR